MKEKLFPKDRAYRLKGKKTPLSYVLPSKNTKRFPLSYYDEESNLNKPLRYATNQNSVFADKQDDHVIEGDIVFENGFLFVPKTNPALQSLLSIYHPLKNIVYEEIDNEKDAEKELDKLNKEVDALSQARSLTIEQIETVSRVIFGKNISNIKSSELRRDVLVYAKKDPVGFLNVIGDPMLRFNANVRLFFEKKLLAFRNGQKEVWLNLSSTKKKIVNVPYGQDPYTITADFLKSDEGLEYLKILENSL